MRKLTLCALLLAAGCQKAPAVEKEAEQSVAVPEASAPGVGSTPADMVQKARDAAEAGNANSAEKEADMKAADQSGL